MIAPWASRSASARFTETRVAPTKAAKSSWVSSWTSLEDAKEVLTRKRHDVGVVERGHRRRARCVVEQGELPEDRAIPLHSHHHLVPFLVRNRDLHRPRKDHEEVTRRIVAMEDDLIA